MPQFAFTRADIGHFKVGNRRVNDAIVGPVEPHRLSQARQDGHGF